MLRTATDDVKDALRGKRPEKVVGGGSEPDADWKDAHEAAAKYLNLKGYKVIRYDRI